MADVNKPKLQLRSSLSINGGDKSPSVTPKLLINHGKPNFTIPRVHKTTNGNATPTPTAAPVNYQNNNNNTEFAVKSTTFNGVFKPSSVSVATKQTLSQNGNTIGGQNVSNKEANEAAKVVLRRPKAVQMDIREREDDENVPEFIRRQRRIQERLANQNILDFENRRSGYFTQVMLSPSSPNRQSFAETMASPAVKPGLEMPAPAAAQPESDKSEIALKEQQQTDEAQPGGHQQQQAEIENGAEAVNGLVEEEEVAKAIEEVNKAVEGEDDDKPEPEESNKESPPEANEDEHAASNVTALNTEEEPQPKKDEQQPEENIVAQVSCDAENTQQQKPQENEPAVEAASAALSVIANQEGEITSNGHAEQIHHAEELHTGVTISHVNGFNGPSLPAPDPSGEKGVNYETKTVVSFSQELGNGDNKYPDTVKVTTQDNEVAAADSELKDLSKLKFEIKIDNQDIEVKPVLVNETA